MAFRIRGGYSPLYFLASLGSGGLAVSFYIYLMFMIPHPGTPLITADTLLPLIQEGTLKSVLILGAMAGIAYFAQLHYRLLVWNIRQYLEFKETAACSDLIKSSKSVSLMVMPLTYAMTINVSFVVGAVFVPGLWSVVEYLFPFAIMGFLAVGVYAMKLFISFITSVITQGGYSASENNNFSQLIAIFAFAMIAVGLAAPGAMSHYKEISAIGLFFSIFFASIAMLMLTVKLLMGFKAIFEHGVSKEASATLWIMIPILTLLGITFVRWSFGFAHNFEQVQHPPFFLLFILTSVLLSIQIVFGLIGYFAMKKNGYFEEFLNSDRISPASYALVCPGVAFFVFGFFFLNFGLVKNGIIELNSAAFLLLIVPLVYVQFKTVMTMFKLNRKMLTQPLQSGSVSSVQPS